MASWNRVLRAFQYTATPVSSRNHRAQPAGRLNRCGIAPWEVCNRTSRLQIPAFQGLALSGLFHVRSPVNCRTSNAAINPGAVQGSLPDFSTICFIPRIRRIFQWNRNRMGEHGSVCQTIRPVSTMSRIMSQICDNYVLGARLQIRACSGLSNALPAGSLK